MDEIKRLRRRKTYLLRAQAVREAYKEHKQSELTDVKIFAKFIQPRFFITKRSFDEYIRMNATQLLKELEVLIEAELNKPCSDV